MKSLVALELWYPLPTPGATFEITDQGRSRFSQMSGTTHLTEGLVKVPDLQEHSSTGYTALSVYMYTVYCSYS